MKGLFRIDPRPIFVAFTLSLAGAASAAEAVHTAQIWPHVVAVKSDARASFDDAMKLRADNSLHALATDFGDIGVPLAGTALDLDRLAEITAQSLESFEHLRPDSSSHVDTLPGTSDRLDEALVREISQRLKPATRTASDTRDNDSAPQAQAAFVADDKILERFRYAVGNEQRRKRARELLAGVDLVLSAIWTVESDGKVLASLTIEKLPAGPVQVFKARETAAKVAPKLAAQLADFFKQNRYAAWLRPEPKLEWIAPPPYVSFNTAPMARVHCKGQNARLPFSRELLQASQAATAGAATPVLIPYRNWIVADRQRAERQYYLSTYPDAAFYPRGPVFAGNEFGSLQGLFWCVRGPFSQPILIAESLYRLIRKIGFSNALRGPRAAVEYLLNTLSDPGAYREYLYSFSSAENALNYLRVQGYFVEWPRAVTP